MLRAIQINIHNFLNKGHERSLRAKRNIIKSVLLKGGGIAVSLLLIPLTINYVNPTQYGVWLTLSSLITWVALFDMGLGSGLKNKLTETITLGQLSLARNYVSSTYAILTIISAALFLVFCSINHFVDWQVVLNAKGDGRNYFNNLVLILFAFFCFQFIIQLINTVFIANQAPAKTGLLNFVGQLLTLVIIYFLSRFTKGSLTWLVVVFAGTPLLVLVIGSIWHYTHDYKAIAPGFSYINFKHARKMLSVGSTFFIIQVAALVLYESDNIVITQLFGPREVTTFNIAYKLFSVVLMFFVIVITPFWTAFAEAYTKNDYEWIRATIAKMNKMWAALSFCAILLLILSPWLYKAWIGNAVTVPLSLSVATCVYTITLIWQAIHVQLINGTGKVKLQLYLSILAMLINIPLSIVLGKWIGLPGIPISNTILFVIMGVLYSMQTNRIINQTAKGIFNA